MPSRRRRFVVLPQPDLPPRLLLRRPLLLLVRQLPVPEPFPSFLGGPTDIRCVAPREFRFSDVRRPARYPIARRRFPESPLSFFDDHLHVTVGAHRGFWFGVLDVGPLQGPPRSSGRPGLRPSLPRAWFL